MKQWVPIQFPIAGGLDTGLDPRARPPQMFEVFKDGEWELQGGVQTRKPFATRGVAIQGGGSLSNVRRIVENGDELVCFTKDALYSYSPSLAKWVLRGTHLAAKIDEATTFASPSDQVDCDRAELNGTVIYSWYESSGSLMVAAIDKVSGGVILAPTGVVSGGVRARLVALSTKVLLVFSFGTAISAIAMDPADPGAAVAGGVTNLLAAGISSTCLFDIVRVGSTDTAVLAARRTVTTSYSLLTVTAALVVTATTKARVSDGPIAVSVEPTGTSVQIVRSSGAGIIGDFITIATFADVFINQSVGTWGGVPGSITACHRATQNGGAYRCYAFWCNSESTTGAIDWFSKSNWVDTAGTISGQATFMPRWTPRSRPFARDGYVYIWGAFIGQTEFHVGLTGAAGIGLQCSYFLLRDDKFLVAKAANCRAGATLSNGYAYDGAGWMPQCQDLGSDRFAFMGTVCRVINIGTQQTGFASRSPQEIITTFDSNEARRCARLGRTMYIAAGELLQYDGEKLTEVGFHHSPWYDFASSYASVAIAVGTYGYKTSWRAANAAGEVERSSCLDVGSVTLLAAAQAVQIDAVEALYLTHRSSNAFAHNSVAWEVWRTAINPTADAAYYLVSSKDPAVTTNPNRYIFNVPSAGYLPQFKDEMTDAVATTKESNPENGGYLESVAPPASTIVVVNADRVFLAGIAGQTNVVWYSKLRNDGEVATFFDGNTIAVPTYAGAITGLGFVNETLIAFTASSIYALDGQGVDNIGQGQNYGPARLLSSDVGAVAHESIAFTPMGLIFKSAKGWHILNRGFALDYIGDRVKAYDSEAILGVQLVETQHQVRCLSANRMLVWDYVANDGRGQWGEWTIANGVSSCMLGGVHHYASSSDVAYQRSDYTGINYGMELKFAPIKLNDLQGAGSVRWLDILGEYRGTCKLQIDLWRDYGTTAYQTNTWTPSPTVVGGPLTVSVGPSIPKCSAISVGIKVVGTAGDTPTTEGVRLTGLALEVGIDQHINRRMGAANKT